MIYKNLRSRVSSVSVAKVQYVCVCVCVCWGEGVVYLLSNLFFFLAVSGLSCGMQDLSQCMGSVVVAHGLSCPAACRILAPQAGIKLVSSALQDRFLTTGPPGESPSF